MCKNTHKLFAVYFKGSLEIVNYWHSVFFLKETFDYSKEKPYLATTFNNKV